LAPEVLDTLENYFSSLPDKPMARSRSAFEQAPVWG
jgi:hypothetical protein